MTHILRHVSGVEYPLHECDIMDEEGRMVADLRQNGWLCTSDFHRIYTACIGPEGVTDLWPERAA